MNFQFAFMENGAMPVGQKFRLSSVVIVISLSFLPFHYADPAMRAALGLRWRSTKAKHFAIQRGIFPFLSMLATAAACRWKMK
jgi:hypothetical protein